MKKFFFAAASILSIAAFGCAAETSSPEAESSSAALSHTKAPVVGEFDHCGGFMANAPVCGTGLKCHLNKIADTGGICVKSGWGDHCGGFIANAPTCEAGLECVLDVSNPDSGGSCDYASYGQSCGGFIASAVECGAGLVCAHVDANGNRTNPDAPGLCFEGAGQACGGNMTTAHKCAPGLSCQGGPLVGDVGGTCQ